MAPTLVARGPFFFGVRAAETGNTCDVKVFFTANQIGPLSNTLSFTDYAPGSPQQVSFPATVINPMATFHPTQVNFGTVKQGQARKQM